MCLADGRFCPHCVSLWSCKNWIFLHPHHSSKICVSWIHLTLDCFLAGNAHANPKNVGNFLKKIFLGGVGIDEGGDGVWGGGGGGGGGVNDILFFGFGLSQFCLVQKISEYLNNLWFLSSVSLYGCWLLLHLWVFWKCRFLHFISSFRYLWVWIFGEVSVRNYWLVWY